MDLLELLQSDSDNLRELIFEVKTAEENSSHESEAFTALVAHAKMQADAKERLLSSLHTQNHALDAAIATLRERDEGAANLEAIIECCTNRSTWRASVTVYCELLEQTIQHEARELLPLLFDHLSHAQMKKLAETYSRLRGFGRLAARRPARAKSNHLNRWQELWKRVLSEAV